jgi:hypothetical protein
LTFEKEGKPMATELEELKAQVAQLQQELDTVKQMFGLTTTNADATPPHLTCGGLTVLGKGGQKQVEMGAYEVGGFVDVFSKEGAVHVRLIAERDGGAMSVHGNDGPAVEIDVDESGGTIEVYDNDGEVIGRLPYNRNVAVAMGRGDDVHVGAGAR